MADLAPWDKAKLNKGKQEIAPWDKAKLNRAPREVPKLESAWTGVEDIGTFGLSPIAAGSGAALGSLSSDVLDTGNTDGALVRAWEAFKEGRKERGDYSSEMYEANPKSYMAGGLIGGAVTAPLLGAQQVANKAPLLQKLLQASKVGGKAGAVYGTGSALGSADSVAEGLGTIGLSTGMGAGFGALPVLGGATYKGAKSAAGKSSDFLKKLFAKKPTPEIKGKAIIKPDSASDITKLIKTDKGPMIPTEQTKLQNLKYKAEGLEPLTPIQQQPKFYGDPTPHQYAETYLKARSPKLYKKGLKQAESLENVLDKFKRLGADTKEGAGLTIKSQIDQGKKIAGKTIGQYKDKASLKKFPEKYKMLPPVEDDVLKIPVRNGENVIQRFQKVRNYKELDDLISDVGTAKRQLYIKNGYQNSRDTYDLEDVRRSLVEAYKKGLPKGKPKKAYEQYALVKQMYNDTLKNAGKPKRADKIFNDIVATGETIKEFKKMAYSLKRPELVDYVRDNYLSNIFNSTNWKSTWSKAMKNQPLKELVDQKTIDKVNLLLKYDQQMKSTSVSTVNPPRSGIINLLGQKGVKGAVVDLLFGETRQLKKVLNKYENIVSPKVPKNIDIPYRGARSAVGRTIVESNNKD